MSEEFKIQAVAQTFQNSNNGNKGFNTGAQDFNPKRLSKQSSNYGGEKNNWVPQKKDNKKQWKRKDQVVEPINNLSLQKSISQVNSSKKENRGQQQQLKHSISSNSEKYDDFKSVQKQMSLQNQSANSLLGFSYHEDEYFNAPSYSNTYKKGRRRGNKNNGYRPLKDYSVQSAFKFIVKRGKDYMLNLYDPNENIEWKDVLQVIFNMINASDVQCPICLENLPQMIAPKITKCGHIYCWPCVLQYLAFEKERNWKRCPLCNESIYKHELKNVKIVQSNYYKEGSMIKFNLMVRNKANIIVKDKHESQQLQSAKKQILPTQKFPSQRAQEYHGCRILVSDNQDEKIEIERDLEILRNDAKLMQSSQEFQKIPYINEAIDHCNKELNKLNDPEQGKADIQEEIVDFKEKKRKHNKKQTLKKHQEVEEIEENSNDCFYFYQSSTGENIFLHPICYKILQQQYSDYNSFPTQIEGQVLEVNQSIADQDDPEFYKYKDLNHLPDGAPYGFVEVDMSHLVSEAVYKDFEKQLAYREKQRQRKQQREETYADKVNNIQNEKFEQIKREAINSMINSQGHSIFLKPGVVRNLEHRESIEEENEEEHKQDNKANQEEEEKNLTKDQKLWKEFGNLIAMDKNKINVVRKDTFEGAEVMKFAKKDAKKITGSDEEFECKDEGFAFASSQIVVVQGKGPKKRKRGRH